MPNTFKKRSLLSWVMAVTLLACNLVAQELQDAYFLEPALQISREIQERHLPFDTITDPTFASPQSDQIVFPIEHHGDSAIWSGHYLASEAYRFAVTRDPEAARFAARVLNGIHRLLNVGGTGLLARFSIPTDSQFAESVTCQRSDLIPPLICRNRNCAYEDLFEGTRYTFLDKVSRDQYMGVAFGLGVAYELLEEESLKTLIRQDVSAIIDYLEAHGWVVVYPDNCISTTFLTHPEQILSLLQVGKLVWPERYSALYDERVRELSPVVDLAISSELLDTHNSYFKFNLDHISMFHLLRLETNPIYRDRYLDTFSLLRNGLRAHQNAHFNAIEIGATGNTSEDLVSETIEFLRRWLQRPRRNLLVRNSPRCGHDMVCITDPFRGFLRAADPLRIDQRPTTDFLWQRSPFQLDGGGDGRIEHPGVDYILPYWMLRYYLGISN